jgi:hypothetical protein
MTKGNMREKYRGRDERSGLHLEQHRASSAEQKSLSLQLPCMETYTRRVKDIRKVTCQHTLIFSLMDPFMVNSKGK